MTDKELIQELRDKAAVEGSGSTRRLLELAARALEQRQWVSVKDRMPDNDKIALVLVMHKIGYYRAFAWYDGHRWISSSVDNNITHWMPLPKPPEVDK